MSFIGDYFNHKEAVNGRIAQLEALNDVIAARKEEAGRAGEELYSLESRIAEIRAKYPELSEEEAMRAYFETLRKQNGVLEERISLNRKELNSLLAKLGIASELDKMAIEKEKLESKLRELKEYISGTFKPSEILFVAYETMNGQNLVLNAFYYVGESKPEDDGVLYRSLSGDKLIGFTKDFKATLYYDEGDKYFINAKAATFVSFSEACIDLNNPIYLKKRVTTLEINGVLKEFNNKYYLKQQNGGKWAFYERIRVK